MVPLNTRRAEMSLPAYLHHLQEYNKGLFATSEWSQSTVKSAQMGILHWRWNARNTCVLWIYTKWAFTARGVFCFARLGLAGDLSVYYIRFPFVCSIMDFEQIGCEIFINCSLLDCQFIVVALSFTNISKSSEFWRKSRAGQDCGFAILLGDAPRSTIWVGY